jgi:hypothetical protein
MRRVSRAGLVVAGCYFALAVIPYWSYWSAGGTMIAGKGGDPATDAWFLAWTPYALAHGHNPLVSSWGNYPAGVNAITGIGMPLLGVLGAPVIWAFGAFAGTMLWFTLAFPLSALAGYLFVREFVAWRPAAFAGGLLYGFSPYLVAHGGSHLNLVFVPLPPLIFLVLYRILSGKSSWLAGLVLGGLCVAQFLISAEVLASTAVIGAVGVVACWACGAPRVGPRVGPLDGPLVAWRALVVALVVAVAFLCYPVWLLLAGPGHLAGLAQQTSLYRGNLLAPLIPDSTMFFRTAWSTRLADTFSGGTSENGLYLGVPLLVLLIVAGVVLWRRLPVLRVAVVVSVAALVLSLGSRLTVGRTVVRSVPLPGAIFSRLPVLDNAIAARYSLYVMLGAAVILAVTLCELRGWARDRSWAWFSGSVIGGALCVAVAVVALVPLLPSWPYWLHVTQVPAGVPAATAQVPAGSVAVTYPFPSAADAYPMLWQVAAGMRYKSPGGRFVAPSSASPVVTATFAALSAGHPPARAACVAAGPVRGLARARRAGRSGRRPAVPGRPVLPLAPCLDLDLDLDLVRIPGPAPYSHTVVAIRS